MRIARSSIISSEPPPIALTRTWRPDARVARALDDERGAAVHLAVDALHALTNAAAHVRGAAKDLRGLATAADAQLGWRAA
jgi:hypothetical protein